MARRAAPLHGVSVLDAAHVIAGPGIASRLSDFGADVVKIEQPGSGDTTRALGWKAGGETLWWRHLGRNKKSVTLDIRTHEGQEIMRRMVGVADVLVESFRPGTMERWGLGPDDLLTINPRLVYTRVSGFGQHGPYAQRPGFGTIAEALSGFVHMSGFPEQPPVLPPIALADEVAALVGAFAVMVALYHRDVQGGAGQVIDVALTDSLFQLLGPLPLAFDVFGVAPGRTGNQLPYAAPRGAYRTIEGEWLALSGTSQSVAMRILRLVGGPDLCNDKRFGSNELRVANAKQLDSIISDWAGKRTLQQALAQLEEHDVAAAPIYSIADVFEDPQVLAHGVLVEVADKDLGRVRTAAPQPTLSETPALVRHLGRSLGEDTIEVLTRLGYDRDTLAELSRRGVI